MTALIAISATGQLASFSEAGVLGLADVHLASTLARLSGDATPDVALAAALTMRAWRTGSPCLDVTRADVLSADPDTETTPEVVGLDWPDPGAWLDHLRASPLVSSAGSSEDSRPLVLDGHLLYLRNTWRSQSVVVGALAKRWVVAPPAPPAGPTGDEVIDAVFTQWTSILTGGPGTGKTTAVARLVSQAEQLPEFRTIAMAAPTGKAAARLAQALEAAGIVSAARPTTLHRLLGSRGPGRGFRHDAANPLPADLVIVDEVSMVSLPLMASLLKALRPTARLLLVGDPAQLASVEAGSVLADLVAADVAASAHGDTPLVTRLTHVYRHQGPLAALSAAVAAGDVDGALAAVERSSGVIDLVGRDAASVTWADLPDAAAAIRQAAQVTRQAADRGDSATALASLDAHRLLCAHRLGPYGVALWARQVSALATPPGCRTDDWWPGKAVLATATTPDIGVVSGDQGVAIDTPDGLRLVFDDPSETTRQLSLNAVPGLATLDAITVHKAQGSEFDAVTVVLPPTDSPLSIRPLLYTAMTRARHRLTLIGTTDQLRHALATPSNRTSGLAEALRARVVGSRPSE